MNDVIEIISKDCHNHKWVNMEQEETLRGVFMKDTKENLCIEDLASDATFSEEYVSWLEKIVLKLTAPRQPQT